MSKTPLMKSDGQQKQPLIPPQRNKKRERERERERERAREREEGGLATPTTERGKRRRGEKEHEQENNRTRQESRASCGADTTRRLI